MRKSLVPVALVVIVAGMTGMSFAAVPLYRAFCAATGFAGTPDIGAKDSTGTVAQTVTVRFNADVNAHLPWQFGPDQSAVTVKLGQETLATYHAANDSAEPLVGVAVYNVTPETVGKYFHKTACFCTTEQTLQPGQHVHFPLTFWVDPKMATDPDTADIHTVTLSYTFYHSADDAAKAGAWDKAGPHVGPYTGAALVKYPASP